MIDLHERLDSTAAAFTDDLLLDDPSVVAPTLRRAGRSGRWWGLTAAVAGVAATMCAWVLVDGNDQAQRVVPATEQVEPPTTVPLAERSPEQRLRAAFAATLESGFVMTTTFERIDGSPIPGVQGGGYVTYEPEGLVSGTIQRVDGSWITNEVYDLRAGRVYWMVGEDQWRVAALRPGERPLIHADVEWLLGDPGRCVLPVDDRRILVVQAPSGPCPAATPPLAEWKSLGRSQRLVVLGEDGRVLEHRSDVPEEPVELGFGENQWVTRFTASDGSGIVRPDPEKVTEVELSTEGYTTGVDLVNGYVVRE